MRINVETEFMSDMRFIRLIELIQKQNPEKPVSEAKFAAIGSCIVAWGLSFHYWKHDKELIPEHAWKGADMNDLLFEVGLAERRESGIYVRGSERNFEWYHTGSELLRSRASRAGKASAKARLERFGTAQPIPSQRHNESSNLAELSRTKPNPSSSSSSSYKKEDTSSGAEPISKQTVIESKELLSAIADVPPLIEIWNQHCGSLPRCKIISTKREAKIKARWRERPERGYWEALVKKLATNKFYSGKNKTGWRASFDFLLQPDTIVKNDEGRFDDTNADAFNVERFEPSDG